MTCSLDRFNPRERKLQSAFSLSTFDDERHAHHSGTQNFVLPDGKFLKPLVVCRSFRIQLQQNLSLTPFPNPRNTGLQTFIWKDFFGFFLKKLVKKCIECRHQCKCINALGFESECCKFLSVTFFDFYYRDEHQWTRMIEKCRLFRFQDFQFLIVNLLRLLSTPAISLRKTCWYHNFCFF